MKRPHFYYLVPVVCLSFLLLLFILGKRTQSANQELLKEDKDIKVQEVLTSRAALLSRVRKISAGGVSAAELRNRVRPLHRDGHSFIEMLEVDKESLFWLLGLRSGDRLLKVEGKSVSERDSDMLSLRVPSYDEDQNFDLLIERENRYLLLRLDRP